MSEYVDNFVVGGKTFKEWDEEFNPPPENTPSSTLSQQEAEKIGMIRPEETPQEPVEDKEYMQNPSYKERLKDAYKSEFNELSKFFLPKAMETEYKPTTRAGDMTKTFTKYTWATVGLAVGGEVGGAVKAASLSSKIPQIAKTGSFIGGGLQKLLGGDSLFKSSSSKLLKKIGVGSLNTLTQGLVGGALIDWNLHDKDEARFADAFGATDNPFISYFQTDETDSDFEWHLKNVLEGAIFNAGVNSVFKITAPLFKKMFKNTKTALKTDSPEIAQQALTEAHNASEQITKIANTADLLDNVKNLRNTATTNNQDASELLIQNIPPKHLEEAHRMLDVLDRSEDIFVNSDGTWNINVTKWEDAYKLPKDEYLKQTQQKDLLNGESNIGNTAIKDMNAATEATWKNRGWLGQNDSLLKVSKIGEISPNTKSVNRITKNYKDKFEIDNNIKVEFTDGLTIKGKQVDGNTYKGRKSKDIIITIDKNTKTPYAVLRSELEHARDIAKSEVPNQKVKHFSRYNGLNEGEMSGEYTYKKSQSNQLQKRLLSYKEQGLQIVDNSQNAQGWGSLRKELIDADGNNLGYIEYDIDNKNIYVGYVKAFDYGNRISEKFLDNLIAEHPDKKIIWDAVSDDGQKLLNMLPEQYINKIEGKSLTQVDTEVKSDNNTFNGGLPNAGSNSSKTKNLQGKSGQSTGTNPRTQTGDLQTERTNDVYGSIPASNHTTNAGRKTTNTGISRQDSGWSAGSRIFRGENVELKSLNDVDTAVKEIESSLPPYEGYDWKTIADDADSMADDLIKAADTDPELVQKILTSSDISFQAELARKTVAIQKVRGALLDKIDTLGKEADKTSKASIINNIKAIDDYAKEIASGFGGGLNAVKFTNRAIPTFGEIRRSKWVNEGLESFSELLAKDIKEIFNLHFTRGEDISKLKQELLSRVSEYGDGTFNDMLANNKGFADTFNEAIDVFMKNPEDLNSKNITAKFKEYLDASMYDELLDVLKLAPKNQGKLETIRNWIPPTSEIAEAIKSYYVHNLLSGTGTLAKNVISGGFNTAYYPLRKILGGYLGGGDGMTKEGIRTFETMADTWFESWQLCKQAFIKGEGQFTNIGRDAMNMGDDAVKPFHDWNFEDGSWDNVKKQIQNLHSVMTRAMGASDEFLSQLNYRSVCRAKALNSAEKLAQQTGRVDDEQWIKDKADEMFKTSFDDSGRPLDTEALYEARQMLYQTDLDGTIFDYNSGQKIYQRDQTWVLAGAEFINNKIANTLPGKIIFPFIKTGANILQMNLDHNAIYTCFSKSQRELLIAKTPEGAIARAQVAFGFFSLGLGSIAALSGLITGSAPQNQQEKQALYKTGWRPYSFKLGDKYVSYQGYEPIHTILGFAADTVQLFTAHNETDESWFTRVTPILINNFIDKAAFRTGISHLGMLFDPDETNQGKWEQAMAQTVQGFLPDTSMVKSISTLGKRAAKKPVTLYDKIFNNYMNRGLGDYRRDIFGEKQSIYNYLLTTGTDRHLEPEYQALYRLSEYGYNPSEMNDFIYEDNEKTNLRLFKDPVTKRTAYDLAQEKLTTLTIEGQTLREAVRECVTDDEFESLPIGTETNKSKIGVEIKPDDSQIDRLNDIFREYKAAAKQEVLEEYPEMVNSKGMTLQEAKEAAWFEKEVVEQEKALNSNAEKILQFKRY